MARKGVFKFTNKKTGRVYIGSSATNLDQRIYDYWDRLKLDIFHNKALQDDFNKYGGSNFKKEIIIDNCSSEEEIIKHRDLQLKRYKNNTYNKDVPVYFGGGNHDPWTVEEYKKLNPVMKELAEIIIKSNLNSYNKIYLRNRVKKGTINNKAQLNKKIKEKEIEEADKYWQKAVELSRKKNYKEAIKYIKKAIKLRPKHKGYQSKLKELQIKQEKIPRKDEALEYFLSALSLEKKGRYVEAIWLCEKAIELDKQWRI